MTKIMLSVDHFFLFLTKNVDFDKTKKQSSMQVGKTKMKLGYLNRLNTIMSTYNETN